MFQDSIKDNIFKSFGYADEQDYLERGMSTTDAIRKGIVEFDDEIEKAVYADTAENRKLGRVGMEYHKGRKKTKMDEPDKGGKKESSFTAKKDENNSTKKDDDSKRSSLFREKIGYRDWEKEVEKQGIDVEQKRQEFVDKLADDFVSKVTKEPWTLDEDGSFMTSVTVNDKESGFGYRVGFSVTLDNQRRSQEYSIERVYAHKAEPLYKGRRCEGDYFEVTKELNKKLREMTRNNSIKLTGKIDASEWVAY